MGPGSPGFVPGGLRRREDEDEARGHVHCWQQFPGEKERLSGLRRPGVDVEIGLSVAFLMNGRRAIFTSAQGVTLIPFTPMLSSSE